MISPEQDSSPEAPATPAELEAEIARLADERDQCEAEARRLMEREAAGEGVFAAQVFELKQKKQVLATEIRHLQVRLNHLLLGLE